MLALQFSTVEPGYYDINVYNTLSITSALLYFTLLYFNLLYNGPIQGF